MRIIITNEGIKEIKNSFDDSPKIFVNREIINYPHSHSRSRTNIHSKTNNFNQWPGNEPISYSNIDISQPIYKTIEIKQSKLSIPPNKSLLYDYGKEEPGHIIKQMPELISSMKSINCSSSSTLPKLKESYSLKELIAPECFKKLEEKLRSIQKIKLNNRKTDERIFRNDKTGKEIFREINDCKKSNINSYNTSMIEYLLGKTTISDCFIKNISSYEKHRINRLNKISQRILVRKEKEKVFIKEVQSKIDNNKLNEKNKYKKEIESIEENIKSIKKIADIDHPTSKKDKKIFKFLHSELIRDYWKSNKYDHYCFNSNLRKNKPCHQNASSRSLKYFRYALPFFPKEEEK